MIMRLLLSLVLFYFLVPSSAHAWWNKDWDYRKEFVIDTSATGLPISNTVNEATVLIRLHLGNFTYFADTLPGGEDIRFMSGDDITPLKHHVEIYDPVQQIALIWVKVPRLIPGTNLEKIYMYYGNQSAVKGDDPAASYGVDDVLVYHFDGAPADKTAYNNHPQSNSSEEIATAVISKGVQFDGESNIVIPSSPSLRLLPDPGSTVSLWVSFNQEQADANLFAYVADEGASLSLKINGTTPYLQYTNASQQTFRTDIEGLEGLTLESWNQLTFTVNQEQLVLYVNGNQYAVLDTAVEEMGGVLSLGAWADGTQGFIGQVDELHVLKIAASADWVLVNANNQGVASTLIRAGADGQQEGAGEGHNYIAFSLSKLTLEGKITTGILAVMLIFSFVIMFGKGFFLSGVRKANDIFQRRYTGEESTQDKVDSTQGSGTSLVSLFESVNTLDKKLKESPLNRLFKTGMRELNGRLAASTAGAQRVHSLSPNSVSAIRASMDTVVVRENQRLQKQMVLLTIAISGGPFIGLFGTVMGVMITFAEVALAGNVDVNAIAPGISAALVATVAGLAVAIPCLFGYNYLASQIKEVSADMRVFVDEFEARVAEEFGA